MVLGDAAQLTGFGVAIGMLMAFYASRLVRGRLFGGVSATDPGVYVMVAILVGAVSLAATYAPGHRAAKVDPVALGQARQPAAHENCGVLGAAKWTTRGRAGYLNISQHYCPNKHFMFTH